MNKHRNICLGSLVAAGIVLVCLVVSEMAAAAADGPFTAKIITSRRRVHPGGVVEFKFELMDSKGQSHRVPRSGRSRGSEPRLALYDSQGQEIGTYSFRFG